MNFKIFKAEVNVEPVLEKTVKIFGKNSNLVTVKTVVRCLAGPGHCWRQS